MANNGRGGRNDASDPELVERAKRRRFTVEYKLRILAEADACTQSGEVGALLRREGLYSSHLTMWRKQRVAGARAALSRPRGRKRARILTAAYQVHPQRFLNGAPRPPSLPTAVWINAPAAKESAH